MSPTDTPASIPSTALHESRELADIASNESSPSNIIAFSDALKMHHEEERRQAIRRILRMSDAVRE
jgi:hypothetical protein